MPERDAVAWTTVIGGCANAGRATEAVDLFWGMRNARVKDDVVTMVALLTGMCGAG
jgi:pentatricopeptide repeat protein